MKINIELVLVLLSCQFSIGQNNGESIVATIPCFQQTDTLSVINCTNYYRLESSVYEYNSKQIDTAYRIIDSLSRNFPCYEFILSSDCSVYFDDIASTVDTCNYTHITRCIIRFGVSTCINGNIFILRRRRFKILGDGTRTIYCQEDFIE